MTDLQDKTTNTNVNYASGEQLKKEVFISLDGLKTKVRGLLLLLFRHERLMQIKFQALSFMVDRNP